MLIILKFIDFFSQPISGQVTLNHINSSIKIENRLRNKNILMSIGIKKAKITSIIVLKQKASYKFY